MSTSPQPRSHPRPVAHWRTGAHARHALEQLTAPDLARVALSAHALDRFAERSGLPDRGHDALEQLIRDLLALEGSIGPERPYWARSTRTADSFLALGGWIVFPVVRSSTVLGRDGVAVTAISGLAHGTWRTAVSAGLIRSPAAGELLRVYAAGPRR